MADNKKPSEDPIVATDEVGGAHVQRVKVQHGADGSATDVSSASPLPVSDAGGALSVDDGGFSLSVDDNGGSLTVDVGTALPAGNNNIGDVDVASLPALAAGTSAIGKLAANSGVDIGDVDVTSLTGGTVAHDAADSGNPIKVGGRARTALIAAVAQNDRADLTTDKFARLLTAVAPPDERISALLNRVNTESGQLLAALAEGAYIITAIQVTNAHATVGTKVEILDKETAKWKGYAAAGGGGFVLADPQGLFMTTKNQAVNGKCVTTGADVDIAVSGFKIPA